MVYVDGYVIPLPKKNIKAYRSIAQRAGKIWKKYGAIDYFEGVGDDLSPKWAGIKFPQTVKAKPGENVIFSFIVFKSKTQRNRVNNKVMKEMMHDPKMKEMPMPFDMKRMAYGGFKSLVKM
jgi:uncharacterized protein YbaA (DUF1428 family)